MVAAVRSAGDGLAKRVGSNCNGFARSNEAGGWPRWLTGATSKVDRPLSLLFLRQTTMSYYDEALVLLKRKRPEAVLDFQTKYAAGKAKISAATQLFRVMSHAETLIWNKISPPGSTAMDPVLMKTLIGGGSYTSIWFTFDRPYVFNRQAINDPKNREGQHFVMVMTLRHQMKTILIDTMIPDVSLKGIKEDIKKGSCRCKVEGGTITLGLSLPVLEQMALSMTIEHLGGHLIPHKITLPVNQPSRS